MIVGIAPFYNENEKLVQEVEKVKKDKAKVISAVDMRYRRQLKPKKVNAYIVDQEVEINGTKHFTFLKIGEAKKPYKEKNTARNKILFKVNKGDKQILASINEGKKVYLTSLELGSK